MMRHSNILRTARRILVVAANKEMTVARQKEGEISRVEENNERDPTVAQRKYCNTATSSPS
jgi:hypothetical protein